jgi:Holliday junction resolvasome RuvABC endonuclease subunit
MIIGIDPGVTGALVLLSHNGRVVEAIDMPVRTFSRSDNRMAKRLDPEAISVVLRRWCEVFDPKRAIVENVHASPGMGVSSAFSFGHGAGVLEACVTLAGLEPHYVSPSAWKRALGVPADKEASMQRASTLLGTSEHWPLKKHHGRAEAAMLALYGHRLQLGADSEPDSEGDERR